MLIPTIENTKTISDLREKPVDLLKQLESSYGPLYIIYRSAPSAVMLHISEYQRLLELTEDYQDVLKAQDNEKKDKKKISWLKHDELMEKLK